MLDKDLRVLAASRSFYLTFKVSKAETLLSHVLDRRRPTTLAYIVCKTLGVERIVRQKIEPFLLHLATTAALDPPHLHFQKYPRVAAGKIAHAADLAVVPPHLNVTATTTSRFFERRLRVMTRAHHGRMYEQQLDLFSSAGAEAERPLPLSMELRPAATVLDDRALISAIPELEPCSQHSVGGRGRPAAAGSGRSQPTSASTHKRTRVADPAGGGPGDHGGGAAAGHGGHRGCTSRALCAHKTEARAASKSAPMRPPQADGARSPLPTPLS